jgi:membrane-bound lytic murein transglycosylase A
MVDLGEFRDELKGQRIAGRVVSGNLKPFEDRAAIAAGKLKDDEKLHIVYVDDAADAFFLQVQGSGRVQLDDGTTLNIGYDGQNGWPYYAIGRELIKRNELTKDNVSMQAIRGWLETHPAQAAEIMNTNKSYVFFRILEGDGPIGGEGVALTPLRSMAIDRSKLPYGAPIWIDTDPLEDGRLRLQQLMIAQDAGGAIQGAVRGDFFWGYGQQAAEMSGKMKASGEAWILLPAGKMR